MMMREIILYFAGYITGAMTVVTAILIGMILGGEYDDD